MSISIKLKNYKIYPLTLNMDMDKKKVLSTRLNLEFEKKVLDWIIEQNKQEKDDDEKEPVKGREIMEKAKEIHTEMFGEETNNFKASGTWLYKFKNRHKLSNKRDKDEFSEDYEYMNECTAEDNLVSFEGLESEMDSEMYQIVKKEPEEPEPGFDIIQIPEPTSKETLKQMLQKSLNHTIEEFYSNPSDCYQNSLHNPTALDAVKGLHVGLNWALNSDLEPSLIENLRLVLNAAEKKFKDDCVKE